MPLFHHGLKAKYFSITGDDRSYLSLVLYCVMRNVSIGIAKVGRRAGSCSCGDHVSEALAWWEMGGGWSIRYFFFARIVGIEIPLHPFQRGGGEGCNEPKRCVEFMPLLQVLVLVWRPLSMSWLLEMTKYQYLRVFTFVFPKPFVLGNQPEWPKFEAPQLNGWVFRDPKEQDPHNPLRNETVSWVVEKLITPTSHSHIP